MQGVSYFPEKADAAGQSFMFELSQEAVIFQCLQGAFTKVSDGHPGDGLNIPQSAGGVLNIGLKVVIGAVVLVVAGIELF